jgi:hypothetical protein
MKLDLSSCDFQEHTITFQVPEKIMKQMGFYPCKLEVDVEYLFDSAVLPDNDMEALDEAYIRDIRRV